MTVTKRHLLSVLIAFCTSFVTTLRASQQVDDNKPQTSVYSDDDCKKAFADYMNGKAKAYGMLDSHFCEASGYTAGNSSITPLDALKLAMQADGNSVIASVWGQTTYEMHVRGPHERVDTLQSKGRSPFTSCYHLLGSKTGTLSGCHNAVYICDAPDGNKYAAVIINSSWEQRWSDAKKLIDIANRKYKDPNAKISDIKMLATGAAVCIIPRKPFFTFYQHAPRLLYCKDLTTKQLPASVTKTVTALCMTDWIKNLDDTLCIKKGDIMPGSGPRFQVGDVITYRDALYAMFLPSSNTAAVAISREVGLKILNKKKQSVANESSSND